MTDPQNVEVIPLFPVPIAMLPGEVMGMHIFEPRYLELVAFCLENPSASGDFIVLFEDPPSPSGDSHLHDATAGQAGEERSTDIGCVVSLVSVLKEAEDGTKDILVQGVRRVRIEERLDLHAYASAKVTPMVDREGVPLPDEAPIQLYALHRQLILRTNGDEPPNSFYDRPGSLSFLVAACSGMDIDPRLALLKADSEAERQLLIIAHLRDLLPLVSQVIPVVQHALGGYTLIRQLDKAQAGEPG